METEPGCYRVWPHVHGSAGSFAAALTLGEETAPDESQDSKEFPGEIKALSKRKRTSRRTRRPVSKLPPELIEFFDESALGQCQLLTGETNVFGFAENAPDWVQAHVEHGFSITGPEIAYRTGKTWKPSHEASLRRQGCRLANKVMPLTENQAINFVAGLPVQFESGSAGTHDQITPDRRGWVVAQYRERPLGWVKCSSREGKNHLPPAIRMIGIEKSRPSA